MVLFVDYGWVACGMCLILAFDCSTAGLIAFTLVFVVLGWTCCLVVHFVLAFMLVWFS